MCGKMSEQAGIRVLLVETARTLEILLSYIEAVRNPKSDHVAVVDDVIDGRIVHDRAVNHPSLIFSISKKPHACS